MVGTTSKPESSRGLAAYRRLWSHPGVPGLLSGFVLARLPTGAVALAFTLATLQHTHSLATAGLVNALYAVAMGIGMPLTGRAVDRHGAARVLAVTGVVYPLALLLFAAVSLELLPAPALTLPLAAGLAGAALPPVAPVVRSAWATFLDPDHMRVANAIESLLIQAFYVAGPAAVGLLAIWHVTALALVASAAMNAAGVVLVATSARVRALSRRSASRHRLAALRQPGMAMALLLTFVFALASVGVDFAVIAWANHRGDAGLAGIVLAGACVGGMAASALYGAGATRMDRVPMSTWYALWAAALVVLGAAVLLDTGPVVVFVATFVLEVPGAPLLALMLNLVNDIAADGLRAESFSWRMSATMVGVSAGAAVCGVAGQLLGVGGPVLVGVVAALLAAGCAALMHTRVRSAPS